MGYADLCQDFDRENHHTGCGTIGYHRQCEDQDPRQGRYSSRSTTSYFRRKAARRWPHTFRLQHSEGIHSSLGSPPSWWYADLCQDFDRENHHTGCGTIGYYRQRENKDPRQGRYSSRSTTSYFRRKTARRWPYSFRLQYSEGIHSSLGASSPWRYADLCQDLNWKDYHTRCGTVGYHRQCEDQDPRQGRYSSRSTTSYFRRKAIGGR